MNKKAVLGGLGFVALVAAVIVTVAYPTHKASKLVGQELKAVLRAAWTYQSGFGTPNLEPDPDSIVIAVTADNHADPSGILARNKVLGEVDGVIDAGDSSDFGSAFEAIRVGLLSEASGEQVAVLGNHDSSFTGIGLRIEGVQVLDGGYGSIQGIKVFGIADPLANTNNLDAPERFYQTSGLSAYAEMERLGIKPDIVVVHNPVMAKAFLGHVPIVVSGHTHRPAAETIDGTVFLNPGSSGGIWGWKRPSAERPYSMMKLYFSKKSKKIEHVRTIMVFPRQGRQIIDDWEVN